MKLFKFIWFDLRQPFRWSIIYYSFTFFSIGKLCSPFSATVWKLYSINIPFFLIIRWKFLNKEKIRSLKMNKILNLIFKQLKDRFKHHRCRKELHRCHHNHHRYQDDHHQCQASPPNDTVFAVRDLKWQISHSKKTQIPMIITMSDEINAFECNNIDNRISLIVERSF